MSDDQVRSKPKTYTKKKNGKRVKTASLSESQESNDQSSKELNTTAKKSKTQAKAKTKHSKAQRSSSSEQDGSDYENDDGEEEIPSQKKKAQAVPKKKMTKEQANSDTEILSVDNFKPSKLDIPRPKGSPFADSISPDTLLFLDELAENNDRIFMQLKAKEWAVARKDFTDFCGLIMDELHEVDPSIRLEEAKNAVYRQHRDLRFSNDKTPYKKNLSAAFSREGRKFLNAGYFLSIQPGNRTIAAVGMWQPDSVRLGNMRSSIIRNGDLLREALSTDALKELFDGKCGVDILDSTDMLKVAPKNIAKDHPEISLLRHKSFAVQKSFTDEEVVSAGFLEKVMELFEALVPFTAVVNSWV
jgi:uncharacterized protein (TIGR02453 family)